MKVYTTDKIRNVAVLGHGGGREKRSLSLRFEAVSFSFR